MEKKFDIEPLEKKQSQRETNIMKILIVALIIMAVVQVATVAVIIFLGTRVEDLSSDVDDVKSAQSSTQSLMTNKKVDNNNKNDDPKVRDYVAS